MNFLKKLRKNNSTVTIEGLLKSLNVTVQTLTLDYNFSKCFDCNNPNRASNGTHKLNEFLIKYGKIATKYRHCRIKTIESTDEIIAYYSLSNDSLCVNFSDDEFYDELRRVIKGEEVGFVDKYCSQNIFPAIKIEHLAVNKTYQSRKIGTWLLQVIIGEVISNENWYGCQYITVDALNNKDTTKFYLQNDFTYVSSADSQQPTRKMYRPLFEYFI